MQKRSKPNANGLDLCRGAINPGIRFTSIVPNVLIGYATSKTYMVQMMFPKILPPTFVALLFAIFIISFLHYTGHLQLLKMDMITIQLPSQDLSLWSRKYEHQSQYGQCLTAVVLCLKSFQLEIIMDPMVTISHSIASAGFLTVVGADSQHFQNGQDVAEKRVRGSGNWRVSAVLETQDVLNPSSAHLSQKNSSTITKVQAEYYEVVCDMTNAHFVFSVPMDGPPSFSTSLLTVQWILRFEFVASQLDVNWSKS
ncbi:unnamed protein product [Sphagnum compactum]